MPPYQSKDWKSIDPLSRVDLISVLEAVRPACMTSFHERRAESFFRVIHGAGLEVFDIHKKREGSILERLFVGKAYVGIVIDEHKESSVSQLQADEYDRYSRALGLLLGYPVCCTDAFIDWTNRPSSEHAKNHPFTDAIDGFVSSHRALPDIAVYRPMGFVPCSITCAEATVLSQGLKHVLVQYDPVADKELVRVRKKSYKK